MARFFPSHSRHLPKNYFHIKYLVGMLRQQRSHRRETCACGRSGRTYQRVAYPELRTLERHTRNGRRRRRRYVVRFLRHTLRIVGALKELFRHCSKYCRGFERRRWVWLLWLVVLLRRFECKTERCVSEYSFRCVFLIRNEMRQFVYVNICHVFSICFIFLTHLAVWTMAVVL